MWNIRSLFKTQTPSCVVAERLGRDWVGIDLSDKAVDLIHERLKAEAHLWRQIAKGAHIIPCDDLPERTDIGATTTYEDIKRPYTANAAAIAGV